mgnify:FL=1
MTHGMTGTKEHACWLAMRHRCNNPNNQKYHLYGGVGVIVFPDWDRPHGGFEAFFAYMGYCPPDKNCIDRWPNPDGNYEPGNVRWATDEESNNNKRTNRFLTINGKTLTIAQWSRESGVPRRTIMSRLRRGWTPEHAIRLGTFQGQRNMA